jgi:hypothetical protein
VSEPTRPLVEEVRLAEDARREKNWKRWGPYLAERQWATVREDYSADGDPWNYFTHDAARGRAYRWGEDGLLGITDRECRLCFALAMWNGRDHILKERLYGLTGHEGNHGEDVKELYFYLDSSPTHSYLKALYKYPQREFPYERLIHENQIRGRDVPEFELLDTGLFDDDRYFDVFVEYAKASPDDILIRITVHNRGPEAADLHLLPTLWFCNSWSWGSTHEGCDTKPRLERSGPNTVTARHDTLGTYQFAVATDDKLSAPQWLFTENETDMLKLFGVDQGGKYFKDGLNEYVVGGRHETVNPQEFGTKTAPYYRLSLPAGGQTTLRLRLAAVDSSSGGEASPAWFGPEFEQTFADRIADTDQFYAARIPSELAEDERRVMRQGYAGLLWSKQFYHYVAKDWLNGDPDQPPPPANRREGRNSDWPHIFNRDVISMPDKWEYPWYAAWDLAFHMIPFSRLDPQFAKDQLVLFLREWYMHPNGQMPAYEYCFSDVNPPVHAWACWRVYKMTAPAGQRDRTFLARVFNKLLMNFTWWVNRKDIAGRHLFAGGFLGLDNIGLFDRSKPLPNGRELAQADGTAWMAFYCTTMLAMAMELASEDPAYEDMASKFFEHFVAIADAMNTLDGCGLWDEKDGFYYDRVRVDGQASPVRVRSIVGLIPLFAVEVLEQDIIDRLPGFRKRMDWFLEHRQDLKGQIACLDTCDQKGAHHTHRLLAIPSRERLERLLRYLLDENEFLSAHGIRSMSRIHKDRPYVCNVGGESLRVDYAPGDSTSGMFGGNSNWRGPVWLPMNFLLIEALERYHHFYGEDLKVECPTGWGDQRNLLEVSREISQRVARIFLRDEAGQRPSNGPDRRWIDNPQWRELILFYEYFHGDDGHGLGASHQTGWTSLVTEMLGDLGRDLADDR